MVFQNLYLDQTRERNYREYIHRVTGHKSLGLVLMTCETVYSEWVGRQRLLLVTQIRKHITPAGNRRTRVLINQLAVVMRDEML